jgi:cytochrome c-type biogenesis protein CcmH/NrfG
MRAAARKTEGMRIPISAETEVLLRDVEQALDADTVRLMPRLLRLARLAEEGSEPWAYAHRLLAERTIERDPWTASLFARRAASAQPDDDVAWALLGLGQSLLGHHRYAARAYRRALSLAPQNPWYAHNLGHLLDVGLDRPRDALRLLGRAFEALSHEPEVRASYAHALVRAGEPGAARRLMAPLMRHTRAAHHHELYRFIVDQDVDLEPAETIQRRRRKRRHTR